MTVFKDAVDLWGADSQIGMLFEEMGELISAINRDKRERVDKASVEEEIADVAIMLEQMNHIYNQELIESWKQLKIGRLKARIQKELSK